MPARCAALRAACSFRKKKLTRVVPNLKPRSRQSSELLRHQVTLYDLGRDLRTGKYRSEMIWLSVLGGPHFWQKRQISLKLVPKFKLRSRKHL
ncbi:hypothetical protein J6590_085457 [Homalodisca vitripennis]|nr:hypothetical protein J6590_085457 [Homalodisca vitripennis]